MDIQPMNTDMDDGIEDREWAEETGDEWGYCICNPTIFPCRYCAAVDLGEEDHLAEFGVYSNGLTRAEQEKLESVWMTM